MDETCGTITEPTSLKELLEFFSGLHKDDNTLKRLQKRLDEKVTVALGSQSVVDVERLVAYVTGFYTDLVVQPTQEHYDSYKFTHCSEDGIFYTFHVYLRKLYDALLFLYWHVDVPFYVGLESWKTETTTQSGDELYKWLTDENVSKIAAFKVVKGGFKRQDLQYKPGFLLVNTLTFMEHEMPTLMGALFMVKPWVPPRVGDKVAFLRAFCKKMNEEDFKEQFGREVKKTYREANSEEIKAKSQTVLGQLTKAFGEIKDDDFDGGLTPLNDKCYRNLSRKHVDKYFQCLEQLITNLMGDLPKMNEAMGSWNGFGEDTDQSRSRFVYGFHGDEWDSKESEIKEAIKRLTRKNGGLQQLLEALQPSASPVNATSNNVVGILLGIGAAVGVCGAAYAGNLFGFGELVRGAFSGGAPAAANLRS